MRSKERSLSVRLYALLLHLYPKSFRREYGEAMLQLFNDQRRSIGGPGGYAMLWLKTLRDLLLSVPAAHSNEPRRAPIGPRLVWTLLVVLGLVFLVNAMILPAWISRLPNSANAATVAVANEVAQPGAYRALAQVAAAALSTLLALAALVFALRQASAWTGAAAFVAGAALTFMALATNPWLWMPMNSYPVSIAWALGIWPLGAISWFALRAAARRSTPIG